MSDTVIIRNGAPAPADDQHPWPGLASFEECNSRFFYGRETEISELERLVMHGAAGLLFGRSGLGKTSLLQAGLFPRLRAKNCLPVLVRLNFSEGGPPLVEQVRQALWQGLQGAKIECPAPQPSETLWEYSHREAVDFWDARVRLITPVLVMDQFEEIFTLGKRTPAAERQTMDLLEELQALVNNAPPERVRARFDANPALVEQFDFEKRTVKVLLSIREDYLPHLESIRKHFHSLSQNRLRLEPMTGTQALEAVVKPAQGMVDEPVAMRIVEFVAREKAAGDETAMIRESLARAIIEPALLSVVCRELNQRRLDASQPKITTDLLSGAKDQILNDFYEQAMQDIPPAVRSFVEDQLLTSTGYRDRSSLDDALRVPGVTEADLAKLINRRLLRQDQVNEVIWLELTHDLLTGVVQHSRITREQRQAEAAKQRALRAARMYKQRVAFMTALALVSGVLAIFAFWADRIAKKNEEEANVANAENSKLFKEADAANEKNLELVQAASKADQVTAQEMFKEGEWGLGIAYLGHSLKEDQNNLDAAVHLWSAVVYGRRGDGRLPAANFPADATFTVLDAAGDRVLICNTNEAFVRNTSDGTLIGTLTNLATGGIRKAGFSPDGRRLLTVTDEAAQWWDITESGCIGHKLSDNPNANLAVGIAFSRDGNRAALTRVNGNVDLYDLGKGSGHTSLTGKHKGFVLAAAFSPDGNEMVTAGQDGAWVWDLKTAKPKFQLIGHEDWIYYADFSQDGRLIVTTSADTTARIWNALTGQLVSRLQHDWKVNMAAFNASGSRVITASDDGTACIWNTTSGTLAAAPLRHKARVIKAAFSPDTANPKALTFCADNSVYVWDAETGKQLGEPFQLGKSSSFLKDTTFVAPGVNAPTTEVATASAGGFAVWKIAPFQPGVMLDDQTAKKLWSARFSPDGKRVITTCIDGAARIWNLGENNISTLTTPEAILSGDAAAHYAEFSPDGNWAAMAGEDKKVRIWHTPAGSASLAAVYQLGAPARTAKFSPAGDRVVVASQNSTIMIWDFTNQTRLQAQTITYGGFVLSSEFSPDGKRLVATEGHLARVFDAVPSDTNFGKILIVLTNSDLVYYATFSRDGSLIATACRDGTARIWNANDGTLNATLLAQDGVSLVRMIRFSPDGKMAATAGDDGTINIWRHTETTNWVLMARSLRHRDRVNSVAFDPTGNFLISSSADGTAQLWKIRGTNDAQAFGEPWVHRGEVIEANFSPDGRLVATASADGTAGIWQVPLDVAWGNSMARPLTNWSNPPLSIGEGLTAGISGYLIQTNGRLRHLTIDDRIQLKAALTDAFINTNNAAKDPANDQWQKLFAWWSISPESRPPWPR